MRPRSPAGAASDRPSPWPQMTPAAHGPTPGSAMSLRSAASGGAAPRSGAEEAAGAPGAAAGWGEAPGRRPRGGGRREPIGRERAGEADKGTRPARREPAPRPTGRAQTPELRRAGGNAKPVVPLGDGGQHQPLDSGRLDRRHELARERPYERLGERGAPRRPQGRAVPNERRQEPVPLGQPEERSVVDVGREDEPQAVDRGAGIGRGEADAERTVLSLPDAGPGRTGRRAERNLEHATAETAGRVAPPGRLGEEVRTRRGELELDHACSMTRWSPTTTPERSIAPTGSSSATLAPRHADMRHGRIARTSFSTRPSRSA